MSDAKGLQRILIFGDDSDFRKLLLLRLGKMFPDAELDDYDPIASGVPEDDFPWGKYDVLLLDYYLCIHGVTGLDILRKNRKNPQFPATIMLTGAGNEEIAVRALKSGVSDYIRKETLNKDELRESIVNAFDEHKVEKQRVNEATLHGQAFNKSLFYQQIEHPAADASKRVLLLIELDNHEQLLAALGVIVRDNAVRHIAKQSFEVFQLGECNPSITRLSDHSIAMLIDEPDSRKTLEFNLDGLCKHLSKRPYKFDGKKFRYTVSIGVVPLSAESNAVKEVIAQAGKAVALALQTRDSSSYSITTEAAKPTQPAAEKKESTKAAPPVAEAEVTKGSAKAAPQPAINKPAVKETPSEAPVRDSASQETTPAPATETVASTAESRAPDQKSSASAENEKADKPPVQAQKAETKPAAKEKPVEEPVKTAEKTEKPAAPQEQKKEAAKPDVKKTAKPPVKEASGKKPESVESVLEDAALNVNALQLKRSFEEKRIVQTFQPLISFSAEEEENESEMYSTSLNHIDTDGSTLSAAEIYAQVSDIPAFFQYIDRWMLKESLARVLNSPDSNYIFMLTISEASLADATLFNWLRELLSGLEASNPGHSIGLEIKSADFSARQKPAEALINYLRKSHGFKFMLSNADDLDTLKAQTRNSSFDLLKVSADMLIILSEEASDNSEEEGTLLTSLKAAGTAIVVQDVEDATTLTEVISIGADYAIGEFIGESSTQLDDMTNVESFEIS